MAWMLQVPSTPSPQEGSHILTLSRFHAQPTPTIPGKVSCSVECPGPSPLSLLEVQVIYIYNQRSRDQRQALYPDISNLEASLLLSCQFSLVPSQADRFDTFSNNKESRPTSLQPPLNCTFVSCGQESMGKVKALKEI